MKPTTRLEVENLQSFFIKTVTKFATSAKAEVPRRYFGKRAYVIVTRSKMEVKDEE